MVTHYTVDPNKSLQKAILNASKKVDDLTVPLTLIAQSWFKTNYAIFALRGPGRYEDIKDKAAKRRRAGFVYPILEGANKRIKNAITDPTNAGSINKITGKKSLTVGIDKTEVVYAAAQNFGLKKVNLPARPYIFVGGEAAAPRKLGERVGIWEKLIFDHVLAVSKKEIG